MSPPEEFGDRLSAAGQRLLEAIRDVDALLIEGVTDGHFAASEKSEAQQLSGTINRLRFDVLKMTMMTD